MLWWNSPENKNRSGIICDGAVRSGKTFSMSLGFVLWSMTSFDKTAFALCGKTIKSLRRNVIAPLFNCLSDFKFFDITDFPSKCYFEITLQNRTNRYYLFGGKDESSAALIQGVTLGGILLDETALMPRSFVEQAVARCSVSGSRLWFNCNPDNPHHWFKREWIDKAYEKNLLYLHFDLNDNPSLSAEIIKRYHSLYSGAFYNRFVLGKWCTAEGLVYTNFSCQKHTVASLPEKFSRCVMSVDYGTVNPTSAGLWGFYGKVWYRISEYYFSSKTEGFQRTDEEHYREILKLSKIAETYGAKTDCAVVDPSAASFIECIRRHGDFSVIPAKNDVLSGIRKVSDALSGEKIKIHRDCADSIREFSLYRWKEKSTRDCPVKENDHAMDDIRYFVCEFLNDSRQDSFCVLSVSRDY